MANNEYVESVATAIIKQLEMGTAPWLRPWKPGERFIPYNPTTGNSYHGMNAVWLMSVAEAKGFSDTRWMTYKQANAADAQVDKGEKGSIVQFWKWQDEVPLLDEQGKPFKDEDGKIIKQAIRLQKPRVWSATVFNAEQVSGLPERERSTLPEWERHEQAEAILLDSGAKIIYQSGDRAFYRPSTDSITLPERGQFPTPDNFYATALHELGHWTGHASRLNRDLAHPFGSEGYAKEELRAEIASLMLGEQLEIGHDPGQHVAYIGSWIKALQEDPREIFRAASDAEKIVKYLQGREMQQEQEITHQIQVPVLAFEEDMSLRNTPERLYLEVSYTEKNDAKALGARWDRDEKSWYAPPGVDIELFERWIPKRANLHIDKGQDPHTEFAATLRSAGLILDSAPVMDGELRRVQVEGDKTGEKSGSYVGFSDGHPAGYINNYKTGYQTNWKASHRSKVITAKDRARLEAEAAEKRAIRAKERNLLAEQTADLVASLWNAGDFANEHPYLTEKGVQAFEVKVNTLGSLELNGGKTEDAPQQWSNVGELLIPVVDMDSKLWGAQSIDASGRKSFPRGCKLQGGYHLIGQPHTSNTLLIAEGYATGATLHELTGLPVVVAFNSGNLPAVAQAFHDKYPEKLLLIAGDNDHTKPIEKNVGRLKSQEAAQKTRGHVLLPEFEKSATGSDWNDLVNIKGKETVQLMLKLGIKLAEAKVLAHTMTKGREIEPKPLLVQSGGHSQNL